MTYFFSKEFTDSPGPRYRSLGSHSGEEFRDILKELLSKHQTITINTDGIKTSFNPSFVMEAFVALLDEMPDLMSRLKFEGNSAKALIDKIRAFSGVSE